MLYRDEISEGKDLGQKRPCGAENLRERAGWEVLGEGVMNWTRSHELNPGEGMSKDREVGITGFPPDFWSDPYSFVYNINFFPIMHEDPGSALKLCLPIGNILNFLVFSPICDLTQSRFHTCPFVQSWLPMVIFLFFFFGRLLSTLKMHWQCISYTGAGNS